MPRKRAISSIARETKTPKLDTTFVSSSELELFSLPPTDPTVLETYQVPYRPISQYNIGSDIKYKIKGDAEDYIKLSEMNLTFGAQILQSDGQTSITKFHKVGPINNSGHSFFDTISVYVNNQPVTSSNKYSQRSYISNLLNYNSDAMNSHLLNSMFIKDTAKYMDSIPSDAEFLNQGLKKRMQYFEKGNVHYFSIHLNADFFNTDRLFPNMTDLEITLSPSKPEYCLMAGKQAITPQLSRTNTQTLGALERAVYIAQANRDNKRAALDLDKDNAQLQTDHANAERELTQAENAYKLQQEEFTAERDIDPEFTFRIIDPVLWVTKVKLLSSVLIGQAKALQLTPAKFPITRVVTKAFAISEGMSTFSIDNAVMGQLPKRIMYTLIDMDAYSGSYMKNPFNYQHFGIKQTSILVNGKCIPMVPYTPDFSSSKYCREYQSLFNALGIYHGNSGLCITKDDFKNGYTIFSYDLTQNKSASDSSHLNIIKQGDIRIDLQFRNQLRTPIICLTVSEYDNQIEIDKDRNVYLDFNAV